MFYCSVVIYEQRSMSYYLYLINLVDSVAAEIELVKGFLINQINDVHSQIMSPLFNAIRLWIM